MVRLDKWVNEAVWFVTLDPTVQVNDEQDGGSVYILATPLRKVPYHSWPVPGLENVLSSLLCWSCRYCRFFGVGRGVWHTHYRSRYESKLSTLCLLSIAPNPLLSLGDKSAPMYAYVSDIICHKLGKVYCP